MGSQSWTWPTEWLSLSLSLKPGIQTVREKKLGSWRVSDILALALWLGTSLAFHFVLCQIWIPQYFSPSHPISPSNFHYLSHIQTHTLSVLSRRAYSFHSYPLPHLLLDNSDHFSMSALVFLLMKPSKIPAAKNKFYLMWSLIALSSIILYPSALYF